MKRIGWTIACGAGALSIGLHAGGLVLVSAEAPQNLAGGPAQLAMIGNSFEDAVAGTITGATDPVPNPPVETFASPLQSEPPVRTPVTETVQAIRPASASVAKATRAANARAVPVLHNVAPVVVSQPDPASVAQPQIEPAALRPTQPEAAEAAAMDSVTARDAPVVQSPDADTVRPVARPRVTRSETAPRQQPTEPARSHQSSPATQGTAVETTRAGDTQGAAQGNATRTQQGQDGQSTSDGRAAAQYPQLVNRHLSRLRRPNTRFNGATVVSFTISGNGGLAAFSVARSSGNAAFDRLALAHIQRAAPFPRPPAGAQRQFNVTIRAR